MTEMSWEAKLLQTRVFTSGPYPITLLCGQLLFASVQLKNKVRKYLRFAASNRRGGFFIHKTLLLEPGRNI